jgi:dienelactone hydrolase
MNSATTVLQNPGTLPDERLTQVSGPKSPRTLRSYDDRSSWESRASHIREHILVTAGLWPLPQRTRLNPRVFDRTDRDGYSVEKVYFESLPGFLVCGNLYRPDGKGPVPGIICPHGHWKRGRLEDSEQGSVPGRCINLARQGHMVFSYDMVGYNDSNQISHGSIAGRRESLWGLGLLGLQLWNSIRALDFLCSMAEVDRNRIGSTGASGGGSQTFLLAAVDERVTAAAPAVMVAADFQGGCSCENQGHLRLDINNVEIAATMAPKPLLLVAATGDWTAHTMELEYPAIRDIYRLYGAEDRVSAAIVDAPHNYNRESREAVYSFFARWFLKRKGKVRERRFTVEADEKLRVFNALSKPHGLLDERGVIDSLIRRSQRSRPVLDPSRPSTLRNVRAWAKTGLRHALNVRHPPQEDLFVREMGRERGKTTVVQRKLLGRRESSERVPAVLYQPLGGRAKRQPAALVVHPDGKAALIDAGRGRPKKEVAALLGKGMYVLTIDPFLTGESAPAPAQGSGGYVDTYNQTCAARRVQDIVTSLAYLKSRTDVGSVYLVGLGDAGLWCLMARALFDGTASTAIDFNRLDVDEDESWCSRFFVPALRSSGDVRSAIALSAPGRLLVHTTGKSFPRRWARAVYRAAGCSGRLRLETGRLKWSSLCDWLTQ